MYITLGTPPGVVQVIQQQELQLLHGQGGATVTASVTCGLYYISKTTSSMTSTTRIACV